MLNYPRTLEEAKAYKYNQWGGNPNGTAYKPERCAYEVYSNDRTMMHWQCFYKNGKGAGGLYCGIHAKRVPAEESKI